MARGEKWEGFCRAPVDDEADGVASEQPWRAPRPHVHGMNQPQQPEHQTDRQSCNTVIPLPTLPNVTININAPNHQYDQELLTLDLPASLSVADLKGFVNAETNIPTASQQFYLNGQPIVGDNKTLEEAGIKDGEMLAMLVRDPNMPAQRTQQRQRAAQGGQHPGETPSPEQIETIRLRLAGDGESLARIRNESPELANVVNDAQRFRQVFEQKMRDQMEADRARQDRIRLLNEDPFNVEAQREIEEAIRTERVMENVQHALEHNPEVFGYVTMLYINVEVNGHPVKAFVDSGAQSTVMSPDCAEACGIMRLIDKRFAGTAVGVGTAKILGRVHSAGIKIGNMVLASSFTVMEGKGVDLLLGLDMLKRHQATIDLKKNKLCFEGNEVEFLPENEIPKHGLGGKEEMIEGPDGQKIGAESGVVTQPGTSGKAPQTNGNFKGQGQTTGSGGPTLMPTPGASQAGSSRAPAPASQRPTHSNEKIDILQSLGMSREQAVAALDATDGNVDLAAGFLFD